MKIGYTAATGAGTDLKSSHPGGWVGGMKIDNKDHLSPADLAEASCNWSWAELGNSFALIVIVITLCFAINGIAMKTKFTLTNPNLHSPQLYFQNIAII